jgi:hypothetical protein
MPRASFLEAGVDEKLSRDEKVTNSVTKDQADQGQMSAPLEITLKLAGRVK